MSEPTPRTDAVIADTHKDHAKAAFDDLAHYMAMSGTLADFARALEQELAEAASELARRREISAIVLGEGYDYLRAEFIEVLKKHKQELEEAAEDAVKLGGELEKEKQLRAFACQDWADTHTRIEEMAKAAGVVVQQVGDHFVCELTIVEALCAELKKAKSELIRRLPGFTALSSTPASAFVRREVLKRCLEGIQLAHEEWRYGPFRERINKIIMDATEEMERTK